MSKMSKMSVMSVMSGMYMPEELGKIVQDFARPVIKILNISQEFKGEFENVVIMNEPVQWNIEILSRSRCDANLLVTIRRNAQDRRPYLLNVKKEVIVERKCERQYEKIYVSFDEKDKEAFKKKYFLQGFYMRSLLSDFNMEINAKDANTL